MMKSSVKIETSISVDDCPKCGGAMYECGQKIWCFTLGKYKENMDSSLCGYGGDRG